MVVLVLGPYLPRVPLLDARLRLDSLIIPLLGVALVGLALRDKRARLPRPALAYALLLGWLALATCLGLFVTADPPALRTWLAGVENHARPLMWMLITAHLVVEPRVLVQMARVTVALVHPVVLLAALQVAPATKAAAREATLAWWSNGAAGDPLVSAVLAGSRSVSSFGQPGTLGMFCLLVLALCLAHFAKERFLGRDAWVATTAVVAVVGGALSGSKIFAAGIVLLAAFVLATSRPSPRALARSAALALFAAAGTYALFPAALRDLLIRIHPAYAWAQYVEPRFTGTGDLAPKLARTGAYDVIADHPLTGLGFVVVGDTTDSYFFAILMLGGVVGLALLVYVLVLVLRGLWRAGAGGSPVGYALALVTIIWVLAGLGFPTFIQDRAGDVYWLLAGSVLFRDGAPRAGSAGATEAATSRDAGEAVPRAAAAVRSGEPREEVA